MRDLLNALKTLERYGLMPEKKTAKITRETIVDELNSKPKKGKRRAVTEDDISHALKIRKAGGSWAEVTRLTGRAYGTMKRYIDS